MGKYKGTFGLTRYVGAGEGTCKEYDVSAKPAEGMYNFLEILLDNKVRTESGEVRTDQARLPKGAVVKEVVLISRKGSFSGVGVRAENLEGVGNLLAGDLSADEGKAAVADAGDQTFDEDKYLIVNSGTGIETEKDEGFYGSILVKFI